MKPHENNIEDFLDNSLTAEKQQELGDWLKSSRDNQGEFLEIAKIDAMLDAAARNEEFDPVILDSVALELGLESPERNQDRQQILTGVEKYLQNLEGNDEVSYPQIRIIPAWIWRSAAAAGFIFILGIIVLMSFVFTPSGKVRNRGISTGTTCNEIYEDNESLFTKTSKTNSAVLYRKIIINSYKKSSVYNEIRKKSSTSGPGMIILNMQIWKGSNYYAES